jgi:iron complex outermembrane receptor protein
VVARGFNNVFSGAMFVMTDNRWASVPSLRINAYNLIPTINDDIDRIEMVLGPGSALYGPNVDKGVMHIITRSPLQHQGTTFSLAGGYRNGNLTDRNTGLQEPVSAFEDTEAVWQGTLRHAGLFSDNVGYKISAMYFKGTDFNYIDPVEEQNRQEAIDAGADEDTLRIGARDFNAERAQIDARVDWQVDENNTLIFAGGFTNLFSSIEMTGIGSAQGDNWTYWYFQTRYLRNNLFAQFYMNMSDAGKGTFTLRDGNPIVDTSYLWAAQIQNANNTGSRQRWVYGADLIRTMPRTDGTIHGRNENGDDIWEVGGYLQSETNLSPMWDIVLAARADWHSVVENIVISPRAAIVFKPTPEHNIRATYNRAFSQPTSINFSLDLQSSPTLGPFADYGVRALGVPASTGLTFRRDCSGAATTLCMRSPFSTNPTQFLPLDSIQNYWDNAVDGVGAILASRGLDPLDPATEAFLRSLDPTGQVGSVLKKFDAEALAFGGILSETEAAQDIPALVPSITNTIEVGYKGLISDRLLIGADAYWQRIEDFIGSLRFETPNVFYNPQELNAFLVGAGIPADQVPTLVFLLSNVPLGTSTFEQVPTESPTDLYVSYRNFGNVSLWGADFGLTWLMTNAFTLSGSYSYISDNFFPNQDNIGDVALNSPQHKGMLSLAWRSPRIGLGIELRGRYTAEYPVESGVFKGFVPSFTLFDANLTYVLPIATATEFALTATNIFTCVGGSETNDSSCGFLDPHQQMIGAPYLNHMILFRIRQSF